MVLVHVHKCCFCHHSEIFIRKHNITTCCQTADFIWGSIGIKKILFGRRGWIAVLTGRKAWNTRCLLTSRMRMPKISHPGTWKTCGVELLLLLSASLDAAVGEWHHFHPHRIPADTHCVSSSDFNCKDTYWKLMIPFLTSGGWTTRKISWAG